MKCDHQKYNRPGEANRDHQCLQNIGVGPERSPE
jgi:hypothetical protein